MDWDVDVKDVKARRPEREKKAMTKVQTFGMEGDEKAGELAKARADVDGGHMAVVKALTIR